jgi:electron-transferring-flavoprotein dehydrogenase
MPEADLPAREAMEFDVVVVGAGPAGLAAAIRLKQVAPEASVVVIEKGSEVGAHILSGWRDEDTPIKTPVSEDRFLWLAQSRAFRLPNFIMPPLMNNHGNYVASLGNACRWLARKADALGVEIFPGFAAAELLFEATWDSTARANRSRRSRVVWSCAAATRSSRKARGAISRASSS